MLLLWWTACVIEPAPGMWFQFEPDPAVEQVSVYLGAWEDGSIVGLDSQNTPIRVSPDGEATAIPFPGALLGALKPATLIGSDFEGGRTLASYDRGDTWTDITPAGAEVFACCWIAGDGTLIGTGQQGDPWEIYLSKNGGRFWRKGKTNAPLGTLVSVHGGVITVSAADGLYQWRAPGGPVTFTPFSEAWQPTPPIASGPTGAMIFPTAPWFHPYGSLPWTWSDRWQPGGSILQNNTMYALNLPAEDRALIGVGADGRLRVMAGGSAWRSQQIVAAANGGAKAVLAGPGCRGWTWPKELDDDDETESWAEVEVVNNTDVEVRLIRTNCTGWCEDWDGFIPPGERLQRTLSTADYVIAVGDDGVCYGMHPVTSDMSALSVEPLRGSPL